MGCQFITSSPPLPKHFLSYPENCWGGGGCEGNGLYLSKLKVKYISFYRDSCKRETIEQFPLKNNQRNAVQLKKPYFGMGIDIT